MRRILALAGLLVLSAPAAAQNIATMPTTCRADGSQCVQAITVVNPDGTRVASGGGASGDASAANQQLMLTQSQITNARLGDVTNPDAGSVNGRLASLTASQNATTSALGAQADNRSLATDTTPASSIALLKGQIDRLQAMLTAIGGLVQSGGPVTSYCSYTTTQPTLTTGNTSTCQLSQRGEILAKLSVDGTGLAARTDNSDTMPAGSATSFLGVLARNTVWDGANSTWRRSVGDLTGAWVHAPQSTVSVGGGTIAASGGTIGLVFANTSDGEVINPSTGTLWASWGTPAVNGANSFPILTGGSYRPPSRVAGTLTLLSTATNQTYTFNKF